MVKKIVSLFASRFALFAFIAGFFLGVFLVGFVHGNRNSGALAELEVRAHAAGADLAAARVSQRDAQQRAERLETELGRISALAREFEARAVKSEQRAGSLSAALDRARADCGELGDGIARAQNRADESGILIAEFGNIVRGIQERGGSAALTP